MIAGASYDTCLKMSVVQGFDFDLRPETAILDFGCGSGVMVEELRKLGYDAFGCDIQFEGEPGADTDAMQARGEIRPIDLDNYVLPFEDNTFDLILSDEVFEHVQNYPEAIAELSRIVKPDGYCLHVFPSRYAPIEPHVLVPWGSVFRSYPYLRLWAMLGVHNEFQGEASSKDGTTAKEIATFNYRFLRDSVNYLSKGDLAREFGQKFDEVIFCESEFLKNSRRGKYIHKLSKVLPFLPAIYSAVGSRVILTRRPRKEPVLQALRGS